MAKKQNVKLNKYAWIGICITAVLLVCFIILLVPTKKEKFYKTFNALNTEFDDEDHVFREVSFKKMKRVVKKDSDEEFVYVILGDKTTAAFYNELDEVNQIAKEKGIERVYYLDYESLDEDDMEDFKDYLRENVGTDTNGNNCVKLSYLTVKQITYYPDILVFKDGKLVDRMYDISKNTATAGKSVTWMVQNYIFNR